jgi:hypothetical protein
MDRREAYEQLAAMIDSYNESRETLDAFAREHDLPLGFTSYEGYARTDPDWTESVGYNTEWYGSELCW